MAGRMDEWLNERYRRYSRWLGEGTVSFTSKVIPVRVSLDNTQWVLPTQQVLRIAGEAETLALCDCDCRKHYGRCDNPLDVCLILNEWGRSLIERGEAREVTVAEAAERLELANARGLVHLSLYRPDHRLWAVCSCCPCCCHDLQLLIAFKKDGLVSHADYVAATDADVCAHCGACVDRCVFGARARRGDRVIFDQRNCFGCGLCVSTCPTGATVMRKRG